MLLCLERTANTQTLVPIQNGNDRRSSEESDHPAEAIADFVSECPADRLTARLTRAGSLHIGPRRRATSAGTYELS